MEKLSIFAVEKAIDCGLPSSAAAPHVVQSLPPHPERRTSEIPSVPRHRSPLVWWHVLSLDAPTVAGLWCWFFAASFHVKLHWFAIATIVLGTWCVYVADRLLDGWRVSDVTLLRERHWFYLRHRRFFGIAWLAATILLGYLILLRLRPAIRIDDVLLCVTGVGYFLVIHGLRRGGFRRGLARWFSKELAVGFLFALATAVPALALLRNSYPGRYGILLAAALAFGAGCWLNCVAIQVWEDDRERVPGNASLFRHMSNARSYALTGHVGNHLKAFAGIVAVSTACVTVIFLKTPAWPVFAAVTLSAGIFLWLIHYSGRFRVLHLRIAADAALLTPLLFLYFVR